MSRRRPCASQPGAVVERFRQISRHLPRAAPFPASLHYTRSHYCGPCTHVSGSPRHLHANGHCGAGSMALKGSAGSGIISEDEAWQGFSNHGVLTVGAPLSSPRPSTRRGCLAHHEKVLGHPKSLFVAQLRLLLPVAVSSAFMNNTIVAMLVRLSKHGHQHWPQPG